MDKRLEEQLERMRELSARVAQIHEQLAHNTELMTRDRPERAPAGLQQERSPLHEVRDFRTWSQSIEDERCRRQGGANEGVSGRERSAPRVRGHADHRRRRRHR